MSERHANRTLLRSTRNSKHVTRRPNGAFGRRHAGNSERMNRKMLGIYLNDHLAGSVVGSSLAQAVRAPEPRATITDAPVGEIAREIEEDQADSDGGDGASRHPSQAERGSRSLVVTEFGMRLKPNGRLVGYSPLSRVIELEGSHDWDHRQARALALDGQLEDDPPIAGIDFERLAARAEGQRDRVEDLRVSARARRSTELQARLDRHVELRRGSAGPAREALDGGPAT